MNNFNRYNIAIYFFIFISGILIGNSILFSIPINVSMEINIYQVLSLVITIIIALSVPLFINKVVDNNKNCKIFIVNELNNLLSTLKKLGKCFNNSNSTLFDEEKRQDILLMFFKFDQQFENIEMQLNKIFKNEITIPSEVKQCYFEYHNHVTGENGIMKDGFMANDDFIRNEISMSLILQKNIKDIIYNVYIH